MYGKFFASTFTGSMYGAGPDVFAVWGYVIANTYDSQVELNPKLLAASIGTTPERIVTAITFLCAPDSISRSKNDDGRRLIREGEFAYRVPNFAAYRAVQNEEQRREYNRIKKAEQREREQVNVKDRKFDSQEMSAQTEAETETKTETETDKKLIRTASRPVGFADEFEDLWKAYPRRAGANSRKDALAAFCARRKEGEPRDSLAAGLGRYTAFCVATNKVGTEYVQQAKRFFGTSGVWREAWDIPTVTHATDKITDGRKNLVAFADRRREEESAKNLEVSNGKL